MLYGIPMCIALGAVTLTGDLRDPNGLSPHGTPAALGRHLPHSTAMSADPALATWRAQRLGLFIHWGPVSLRGTEIGWSRGKQVPVAEYDQLYRRFNPTAFDARQWARLAREAGFRYLVITAKHHDGFCLWPSVYTGYHIGNSPFRRDVLRELADACRAEGLQFCTYYSICDWHHPDYPLGSPGGKTHKPNANMPRYVQYLRNQTRELIERYGPLGILWFDGEWEEPWTQAQGNALYTYLKSLQPSLIINNRVSKGRQGMAGTTTDAQRNAGDYDTPEQQIGAFNRDRPWETCMTLCRQWAWKPKDRMKSLADCLGALLRTVGGDGNLLFNVGPMPDGRIEPRQAARLREMGDWIARYADGIYNTRGGPFKPGDWGAATCRGRDITLFVMRWPEAGPLVLPSLRVPVLRATCLSGGTITLRTTAAGLSLAVPSADRDAIATVIRLTLATPAVDITPRDVAP